MSVKGHTMFVKVKKSSTCMWRYNVWHANQLNLVLKLYSQCAELNVDSGYITVCRNLNFEKNGDTMFGKMTSDIVHTISRGSHGL